MPLVRAAANRCAATRQSDPDAGDIKGMVVAEDRGESRRRSYPELNRVRIGN
jgi:hypothetical protein